MLIGLTRFSLIAAFITTVSWPIAAEPLPPGFVYLRDVAPSIAQDIRYATAKNFTGKPVPGYAAPECVLRREAALALKAAQALLTPQKLSLKVFDCYRPIRAVKAFTVWARAPEDGTTKQYYPNLQKQQLMPGYIAARSGHSTGFAIDLTVTRLLETPTSAASPAGNSTANCTLGLGKTGDGEMDMGTDFDCFDSKSNTASPLITKDARTARNLLKAVMERAGFRNYAAEWWHYSYIGPTASPATPQDFVIAPRQP